MAKFVHFEFVRVKGKRNVAVGAATGFRCWENGMLLVCLEIQYKLDRILPRRKISVDQEHVLLLFSSLLFILNLRLLQCLSHRTENSEIREIRKDTVHHLYLRNLGGGL